MANFDYNLLDEIINNAPTAGFGPRVQYGKITLSIIVNKFNKNTSKYDTRPYKSGERLKEGEYFQFTFESDMSEINDALTNPYKRRVDVRRSSNKGKEGEVLTDWSEIVEPSLLAVFGKDWYKTMLTKGVYAEWEDANTVEIDRKTKKLKGFYRQDKATKEYILDEAGNQIYLVNSVPRFLRSFKSKAECQAAHDERYTKKEDAMAFGDDGKIPDEVINTVVGLLQAVDGQNAIDILTENAPYNLYDLTELLTAAGANADLLALAANQ